VIQFGQVDSGLGRGFQDFYLVVLQFGLIELVLGLESPVWLGWLGL
jgi:hypothetical protein